MSVCWGNWVWTSSNCRPMKRFQIAFLLKILLSLSMELHSFVDLDIQPGRRRYLSFISTKRTQLIFHSCSQAIIMKAILQKELGLPIVEIADETATIDGGDVLFTGTLRYWYIQHIFWNLRIFWSYFLGKEFFVGLSERTNIGGARAVAAAFPEFPCTPVKVLALCIL